jgi:NAD-dependent dihydropyrimidine dehydrogenase PreA subunit
MTDKFLIQFPEMPASKPIIFNPEKCTGCNECVDICQVDVFIPAKESGDPPMVLYPGECWYCGCCIMVCPCEGAITLRHPLMNQVHWVAKSELNKKHSEISYLKGKNL